MKNNLKGCLLIGLYVFLIIGFSSNVPIASGEELYGIKAEFKTVSPGVYSETEKKVYDEIWKIMSGDKDELTAKIQAQVNGKKYYVGKETENYRFEFNSAWTPTKNFTPGINNLVSSAKELVPGNRFYSDPEYAAKTGYGKLIAAPFAADIAIGLPYSPKLTEAYVWVQNTGPNSLGGLDHEQIFYKPVYADDTLTSVVTRQALVEVTPAGGSDSRIFRTIGEGDMYNSMGEKVMSIYHSAIEVFKVFKDPSDSIKFEGKVPTNPTVRMFKDWSTVRPAHVYTDKDWETIKGIWGKEYIRGSRTLYWEDVKIGDEPAWTCDGPVVPGVKTSDGITVRDLLMNTVTSGSKPELYKDDNGIYRIKGAESQGVPGGPPGMSNVPKQPNQRSVFQNTEGRKYGVRMVANWMGDDGYLYKFAWRVVNDTDHNKFPESFDRPSYLLKVPYLKKQGKFAVSHGYEGDVGITKGYVCNKYMKDGKHYVDLVVWSETIEGYIWSECYAVVELPSKGDKK
jgi:hypothetical protein